MGCLVYPPHPRRHCLPSSGQNVISVSCHGHTYRRWLDGAPILYAFLLTCFILSLEMGMASAAPFNVAIFVPSSCEKHGGMITKNDVETAFTDARKQFSGTELNFSLTDTCSEISAASKLLNSITENTTFGAIIGPGMMSHCDSAATMANQTNRFLLSYRCSGDNLANSQLFQTFRRTVSDSEDIASAMAVLLGPEMFMWKRVAIFYNSNNPWNELAKDIQRVLTVKKFDVRALVELPVWASQEEVTQQLTEHVDSSIKAIIICIPTSSIRTFLLGAQAGGFTSGSHALFDIDVEGDFSPGVILQPEMTSPSGNLTMDTGSDIERAAEALFVVRTSPVSSLHNYIQNSVQQNLRDFYNAVQALAASLEEALEAGNHHSGRVISSAFSNLTFNGSGGVLHTTSAGELVYYFTVYDYNPTERDFRSVLEVQKSSPIVNASGASIHWPNGRPLLGDLCDFNSCNTGGISAGVVAAIIVIAIVLVTAASVAGLLVRRRMILKEMEKGPNKIILTIDDLVFVSPKSASKNSRSFKSQSIFDKPDLLKASEPSLSLHSFNNEFGEYTDVARYNGDMVYVKELKIKGFEIKGKVRNYLKALRDLRHENVNPFVGCFIDPLRPSLVGEWCQRKSLEDVLSNETIKLDWDFKLSLMTDLVRGMRYLHNSAIKAHGNLKSGNCVIDSRWVLKITDYGLGGMYERYETTREQKPKELLWTAPEVLRDPELLGKGTPKGDVYSFAIILQEIIVRGHPFCMLELEPEEIIKKIRKPPPLCRPSVSQQAAPPSYIQIMKQCWSEMPDMRPDFDQINQQFKDLNKGKKVNVVDTMFKMLEKYSNDLEDIVRQRTLELEEEKKKTENLLAQMLPASVAASLMTGKPVEAESFKEVTIYFSDIVGFTTISAMSTPLQVVNLLNDLYTMFDGTIDNHDVYKVETIGDAYMCVSGLPERNANRHAGEIAAMSLHLLAQCGTFKIRHMPDIPMMLRIGLHTGPCVAGVVGLRMPRYCLFGDTVNTASRMESTGLAYRIHVSEDTKNILDELGGYETVCRGEVELKGRGIAKTYWLVGMDGFKEKLPQPPESSGPDNHGLKAYIDKEKLAIAAKQKVEAEKMEADTEAAIANKCEVVDEIVKENTAIIEPEIQPAEEEVEEEIVEEVEEEEEERRDLDSDISSAEDKKLENGGTTVVEINHVTNEKRLAADAGSEPSRKKSVLKQEDITISAKQPKEIMTPVEAVK